MTAAGQDPNHTVTRMRLRPQPRPVLRLSRKMLIGVGAVFSVGLAAALAFAVMPQKAKPAPAAAQDATSPRAAVRTEALNALPKDYTGIPKLGPPLPGDLGRSLLSAQASADAPAYVAMPTQPPTSQGYAATDPQLSQAVQARNAAHSSQLFFAHPVTSPTQTLPVLPSDPLSTMAAFARSGPVEIKSEPARKRAFVEQLTDRQPVSDERLMAPASPYLLQTGSVVSAALITGIRSDLPGQVLAQITQDVRDSLTGQYLLIPKGSRLIGQYDNAVSFGQSRLLLTWSRLILPNGKSLLLDRAAAADTHGYAGLQDKTDFHWAGILNAAAVSTLLGVGAQAGDPESDSALIQALRSGAVDSLNRAGQAVVERQLNIQPTLTIRPGLPVRVILSRDLVLEPYGD